MIRRVISQLALVSVLSLMSMSASAVVVNAVLTIDSATITDLWSTTLDNAQDTNLPNNECVTPANEDRCIFLGGEVPPAGRAISITNDGYNAGLQFGTLDVQYEATTGEITQINTMLIYLQDLTVNIAGGTVATIINGNGMGVTGCILGTCTPTAVANDQAFVLAGVTAPNGTADPENEQHTVFPMPDGRDTNVIGDANVFHHADPGSLLDNPDFAAFEDMVDSCGPAVGSLCNLLGLLSLDADRYRLDGSLSGTGGDALTLTAQTGNNSVYTVDITTAVVPVPAAVWLFGSALGLVGFLRRRMD